MKTLYIARHGETNHNREGRYLGSIDEPLNENGLKQASLLGKKLTKFKINKIISSPLIRCIQTVEEINAFLNLEYVTMEEFRERKVGVYEGLTREEAQNKYPQLWKRNITRIWNDAPTGGETINQVVERVFSGIKKVKDLNMSVLLITHGFISKVINYYYNRDLSIEELFKYKLENAEVEVYKI